MAYQLRNLKLREVSVVDAPANQKAHIVMFKRDNRETSLEVHPVKLLTTTASGVTKIVSCRFDKGWLPESESVWSEAVRKKTPYATTDNPTKAYTLGVETAKALMTLSFDEISSAIFQAVREKFGTPDKDGYYSKGPWIEDLYMDYVIYEIEDETKSRTYRVNYAFDANGAVTFGEPVEVEEVYVPVVEKQLARLVDLEKRARTLELVMRLTKSSA